jgi:hypothetical protein
MSSKKKWKRMDADQVVRWGDQVPDKKRTPALDKFSKMAVSVDTGLYKELKEWWTANYMTYPDWLLYYFASKSIRDRENKKIVCDICTFYNHQNGNGECLRKHCQKNHSCVVCGHEGHGVFDFRGDQENYVCTVVRDLFAELQASKQT